MMTFTELETAYLALCDKVTQDGMKIVGKAGAGLSDAAGRAALALVDHAVDCREQYAMQQESATPTTDRYNLAALHVNASAPSNSETGWERED